MKERVYKGGLDPCGAVHITIGDGGNREGLAHRYHYNTMVRALNVNHFGVIIYNFSVFSGTAIRNQLGQSSGKQALGMVN